MNLRLILGYVLLVVCLLALAAAVFLEVNNLSGEAWRMQVFTRPVTLAPPVWLLLGAVGGVVLWLTLTRLLPLAGRMIGRGRQIGRERLLKQVMHETRPGHAGPASPNPTDEAEKR